MSIIEGQNSRIKSGIMAIKPNMSMAKSVSLMTDKSDKVHEQKTIKHAIQSSTTPLWTCSPTAGH